MSTMGYRQKNMNKFKKITAIFLIQAFLLLDIAWAGPVSKADCLSPALNINNRELLNFFELLLIENEMKYLIENDLYVGTLIETEFEKKLEEIFRAMGIGKGADKQKEALDIFSDIKSAFKQGEDVERLIRQKEAELEKMAGWTRKDKKELVRDKELLVFLENNQLPIFRRAYHTEISKLARKKMIKKMAALKDALASGSEQEVLELLADTLDVIEGILYPHYNLSASFLSINREDIQVQLKRVFFWTNQKMHRNPLLTRMDYGLAICAFVEHTKAYVEQRNLKEAFEKMRRIKREKMGGFDKRYVLEGVWGKRVFMPESMVMDNLGQLLKSPTLNSKGITAIQQGI